MIEVLLVTVMVGHVIMIFLFFLDTTHLEIDDELGSIRNMAITF